MGRRRSTDDDGTVEKKAKIKFAPLDIENRTQLAKLVQKCEILWNFRHKDYKDVIQKQYAWETIAHKLDLPDAHCRQEWTTMRNYFTQLFSKYQKATRSGAAAVPEPTWELYKQLEFLKDFIVTKAVITNAPPVVMPHGIEEEQPSYEEDEVTGQDSVLQNNAFSIADEYDDDLNSETPKATRAHKPGNKSKDLRDQVALNVIEACKLFKESESNMLKVESSDRFDYFGHLVSTQLRALPMPVSIPLMAKISAIIAEEEAKFFK